MDFLYTTKYGNTVEEYLICIAILVASLFVWRWTYTILRRTFCDWAFNMQNFFDKQSLYRLTNLFTGLIPIAAFYFVKRRLFFERDLSIWLTIAELVLGQIVFLLILSNILEPLAEVILIRILGDVGRRDQKYLEILKQSIEKISKNNRILWRTLLLLVPGLTIASTSTKVPDLIWVAPLGVLLLYLAICFRILRTTRRRLKGEKNHDHKTLSETPPSPEVSIPLNDPDFELKERIVSFFLDIYRHRLRALKDSAAEIRLVDYISFAPNYIYELRVLKEGDWQSRRMTIGPIGEDSGSRSKCFYVIYDYHIVIKIPPIPINDLNKYMEILKNERRIVKRLSMKECIIPSAAVILKLIQPFQQKRDLPSENNEDDYLRFLNVFTELQKYLRIDNTFVFFMDLSQYYFLSHIIQSFHDTEKKVHDEIRKNSEVIGDYRKFEDRHGSENMPFFLEIEKLFSQYQSELGRMIGQFNLPAPPSPDQAKTWFFLHLVGERVRQVDEGMSAEFVVGVNSLLEGIIGENSKAIQAYRNNARNLVHRAAFAQNKGYMEGIITNLLELLAHLHTKKVAMRDLKPDNILVAGNRDKYPVFLAYPKEYKIGLIDVETAVILENAGRKTADQPPLGGTPQYAMPSQFFDNTLLARFYDDLTVVLHLQDWYAIIAVIYRVITGVPLFARTARIMPGIIQTMRAQRGREEEHFHSANDAFWTSALGEFKERMAQNEETFKSVNVQIFPRTKRMFREIASGESQRLVAEIGQRLNTQTIPMSAKDRQLLISSSYQKTRELRKKWESGPGTPKKHVEKSRIISLLRTLEQLKLHLELQRQVLQLLDQSAPCISAYELMDFMFRMVLNRMHGVKLAWLECQYSAGSADSASRADQNSSQTTLAVTGEV